MSAKNIGSVGPRQAFEDLENSIIPQLKEAQQIHEKLLDPLYKVVYVLVSEISQLRHRLSESENRCNKIEHQMKSLCMGTNTTIPVSPPTANRTFNRTPSSSPSSHDPSPSIGSGTPTQSPPDLVQQNSYHEDILARGSCNNIQPLQYSVPPQQAPQVVAHSNQYTETILVRSNGGNSTPSRHLNLSGTPKTKNQFVTLENTPSVNNFGLPLEYNPIVTTPAPTNKHLPTTPATEYPSASGRNERIFSSQNEKSRLKRAKRRTCRTKDDPGNKLAFPELYTDDNSPAPICNLRERLVARGVSNAISHNNDQALIQKNTPKEPVAGDSQSRLTAVITIPDDPVQGHGIPKKLSLTSNLQRQPTKPNHERKRSRDNSNADDRQSKSTLKRLSKVSSKEQIIPNQGSVQTTPNGVPPYIRKLQQLRKEKEIRQTVRCQESRREAARNGIPDVECPDCELEMIKSAAKNPNQNLRSEDIHNVCTHRFLPEPATPTDFYKCTFPETHTQSPRRQ